jgi:peptidoglycan/xylan/chitin deacetylase (PgdA/CDA1 family)/heat shock protein HslJ
MHHPIKLILLVALLLVSMGLAGCAQGADRQRPTEVTVEVATSTPEATATKVPADMKGILWKLDSYVNSQGEPADVLPGTEITIEFEDGQVNGSAGCNAYFAPYEIEGNSLTIGQIGSTMMACEPTVNEQETQYLAALESAASYQVTGDGLQIANTDGETVLVFSVLEPMPLRATTWRLTGYNDGKGGFVSVLSGTEITALFDDDGSLIGSAGCNNYTASYVVEGGIISIGPVAATRKMCPEPEGIMEQESAYLAAMESAATYQIKGNSLEVLDAGGIRLLSYTAETEADMLNPASAYCEEQGGRLEIRTGEGGAVGYCVFPNGSECEEWAFFRGECAPERAPSLAWDVLKNLAYPNEWPSDGVAQLEDGEYRETYTPDSATEMKIGLAPYRLFGDLNGDWADDAAVILVADPGGSGTFYYLSAVLNQDGDPKPVGSQFLGDRVFVRDLSIDGGHILIELDIAGPDDPVCCPTDHRRQTYVVKGEELVLVGEEDLPDPDISARLDVPQQRVEFESGTTSATYQGDITFNGIHTYKVRALAGQTMTVTLTSPHDDVLLSIFGVDGAVSASIFSELTQWTGELPVTQDYTINAVAVGSDTPYTLQVEIVGEAELLPTVEPTPPPVAPEPTPAVSLDNVIYLTFDDGPTGPQWTPQVLSVLAGYNAKATFFVLGQNAQRYPDLIQAEYDAGHAIANHTFDHQSLSGLGREAFFNEVQSTQSILGDKSVPCLRPPYGATDSYTRARAEELGYQIVMWDIDTEDWKRPGAGAIVNEVLTNAHPGAVVLMHDGGGDRSQTLEALETVLSQLADLGYRFEPLCRD